MLAVWVLLWVAWWQQQWIWWVEGSDSVAATKNKQRSKEYVT